jgi:hypothetical protein
MKNNYRITLKDGTLAFLSSDDFNAVKEIAEQIATERKTKVEKITKR